MTASVYLDEDVAVVVAAMLRGRGFVATTTFDEGRSGRSDEEQLDFATDRGWVVVTHNKRHFGPLHARWVAARRSHAGIMLCKRRPPRDLANRISEVLSRFPPDELRGRLLFA